MTLQVVKAVIGKSVPVPAKAEAGKLLSVAFPVTRSDDGGTPSGATISATARVGAAPIPHAHSLNGGMAAVSVLLPEHAQGELLTVTVRISLNGQTTTKIVCLPISS